MTVPKRMLEDEIKALVLHKLLLNKTITQETAIISEFPISGHTRRLDLAIVNSNHLIGFEIKSEADSLSRLTGQVDSYLEYFDKIIVVAASKHIDKILILVPDHVGVWEVTKHKLVIKRRGRKQTSHPAKSYIDLMDVNDLSKLSTQLKIKIKEKNRLDLESALFTTPLRTLKSHLLKSLSERYKSSSQGFYKTVQSRRVTANDIDLLSKHKKLRNHIRQQNASHQLAWIDFSKKQRTK